MQLTTPAVISPSAALFQQQIMLEDVGEQLRAGNVSRALDELFDSLTQRREEHPNGWRDYTRICSRHPLRELLQSDPFTHRAFAKPRGYAGDAVMMDYLYGLGETGEAMRSTTALGRTIFQYMGTRPSANAVRFRRRLIAGLIDEASKRQDARVLAVAAGHLREVELSGAVRGGKLTEFVAFDQDDASLEVVSRDYGHLGVTAQSGSVRGILGGKAMLGQYDFVYAAGLYDYLSAPVAAALTCRLFELTRPGGLLLIPNFLTGNLDAGYMEAFMDWHLIYRSQDDMRELAAALPADQVATTEVFNDPGNAIAFLLVPKVHQ